MSEQPHFERYEQERYEKSLLQLRELIKELPAFAARYFVAMENTTTILTRLNYARDLKIFFRFLTEEIPAFSGRSVRDIQPENLAEITVDDLYQFLDYLNMYAAADDTFIENGERGKSRKVACLRSFFKYYYKKGIIRENVCQLLETPKQHEKPIVRLEPDEVADLLDIVEKGEGLTAQQLRYHKKTVKRDLAILTLFLTTGIRVSELVGINIEDVDFGNLSFAVTRKGGSRVVLYFDEETRQTLQDYLSERKLRGTSTAGYPLFLSLQDKRMSVRSVENMVKKYAKLAAPLKRISPHKLRSTFGTMLYGETGDIYLVADVLGHKDVNTTRRHYAAQSDENRRLASRAVKIRRREHS
ncbi:MAG: tyrosine-type recombinase/integrase [Clostridia bacterium]|nr:tyrosine-type recombinase/integrase [Clostridia bacterium]